MRSLPMQTEPSKSELVTSTFYGLNHTRKIGDGEAWDMKNMTSDYFPLLSPRKARAKLTNTGITSCQGILAKDKLAYISNNYLYYDGVQTPLQVSDGQKLLVSMGAYILVFPDVAFYNTADPNEYGKLNTSQDIHSVKVYNCDETGEKLPINFDYVQLSKPESPFANMLWMYYAQDADGSDGCKLEKYIAETNQWEDVDTTYVAIEGVGIGQGKHFTLSGFNKDAVSTATTPIIQAQTEKYAIATAWKLNGAHEAITFSENKVVIKGILYAESYRTDSVTITGQGDITVRTEIPEMDYVVEGGNRLWGCKYGYVDGKLINEIYASKLGDFKLWQSYRGIASDSYTASIGSDGAWTGAINYNGYPLFFKDNMLHKVYISPVGAHEIKQIPCAGVEQGSGNSLAIVDGVLLYKSQNGVIEYDGSSFTRVSEKLGMDKYKNAVAGTFDNKYYISMQGADDIYSLFVYDTAKRLWVKEDDFHALGFAQLDNSLYSIVNDGSIYDLQAADGVIESAKVEWMWQTGMMGYEYTGKKYISRLNIRMQLLADSEIKIYIEYDSSGNWELKGKLKGKSVKTFLLPVIPHRCDHFRIKLVGKGDAKIYSFSKIFEGGSDE